MGMMSPFGSGFSQMVNVIESFDFETVFELLSFDDTN